MTEAYTVPVYVFISTFPDTITPMTVVSSRANRVLGIYGYDWIPDHREHELRGFLGSSSLMGQGTDSNI